MLMKKAVSGLSVLMLVGVTMTSAQTPSRSVLQTRPSVSVQAAQAPAARAVSPAAAAAVQVTPYTAAGKQVLPANLLKMEDRAIIIVGGRPVAAGDVKRQVMVELRQLSTPATGARKRAQAPNSPQAAPIRDLPGIGGKLGGQLRPLKDSVSANKPTPRLTGRPETYAAAPARSYTEMRDYCIKNPPEISRVRGSVTPNGRFTIEGMCFGEQTGAVEAIGQFPGGNMRLVFERWTDGEIMAFVPPVSGASDHTIALTVVRLDKSRSPAAQARFVATRQIVPVPPMFWSPSANFFQLDVDQGGGNIFSGFTVWGAGHESRSTPFTLLVNPACSLDSAAWSSSAGRVEAFNGWENGPPHQANVDVIWTPRCTTQTTNYIVASSSQRICSIDFSLSAWASCPVGVAP
jgi:hypothetical protein